MCEVVDSLHSLTIAIPNTRYAHFDIMAKAATVEIEDPDAGLRLDDIRKVIFTVSNT
jgi:hypothetical protein